MTLKKRLSLMATAAMLAGSLLSAPAAAQSNSSFSALQGVDAQALSVDEMQAIEGLMSAANLADILGAIQHDPRLTDKQEAKAVALWQYLYQLQLKDPRWKPYVDRHYDWTRLNVYKCLSLVDATSQNCFFAQ